MAQERKRTRIENDVGWDTVENKETSIPPSPPEESETYPVDLIFHDQVDLEEGQEEKLKQMASERMNGALERARIDTIGGRTAWGNESGLSLLQEIRNLRSELREQGAKLESQTSWTSSLNSQVSRLTSEVSCLKRFSEDFLLVRCRRIENYTKYVLHSLDPERRARINTGNELVHDGDAVADASVYTTRLRKDTQVFEELYGLSVQDVVTLENNRRFDTIRVLDAWSTRVGRGGKSCIPVAVTKAFDDFIAVLKRDLRADPGENNTELGELYQGFWVANADN